MKKATFHAEVDLDTGNTVISGECDECEQFPCEHTERFWNKPLTTKNLGESKISSQYHTVVPSAVRTIYDIKAGDVLEWHAEDNVLIVKKQVNPKK